MTGRRRVRLLPALVAVVVLAAAASLSWTVLRPLPEGPLHEDIGEVALGFPVDPGRPFTFGAVLVLNSGTDVAVLDGVELRRPQGSVDLLEAAVLPVIAATGGTVVTDDAWPPRHAIPTAFSPLAGYRVRPGLLHRPGDRVQVLLELVAGGHGGSFQAVAVRYHVGGEAFEVVYPFSLRVCVPRTATPCDSGVTSDRSPLTASADRLR